MRVAYKVWIEMDGKSVFGGGIYQLLLLVRETGSLHKAALMLKMSYRAAWGKVRNYEDRLGVSLLEKGRHGRTGARLTPEGELIVDHFRQIMDEMNALTAKGPLDKLISEIRHIRDSN